MPSFVILIVTGASGALGDFGGRGARTVSDQVLEFLEREPRIVLCGHERNFY